ncbi:MAG: ATP synthase F0 subunit B [Flavobacteriales bacterium]|nr:ATP synthase F0 subunit B [Flavobacteriales bacterium]
MELVKPDIGLLFWMTTCFIILLFLMKKYAWGPILAALHERERGIQEALDGAEGAKKEIAEAASKVEQMLSEGKAEKEALMKLAKEELMEYKNGEQQKINTQIALQMQTVKEEIEQQKRAAVSELKNKVAELSIEIAEKIIKKELRDQSAHNELIKNNVEDLELN